MIAIYDTRALAQVAVISMIMLMMEITGSVGVVVAASPKELYVLEEQEGVLRCQDRTTSPYRYVSNARWYHEYADGSNDSLGISDSVHTYRHTLTFYPISSENEGKYFCCTPNLNCSNRAHVRISVPPSITAAKSYYAATIGSQITLTCNIAEQGIPPAEFTWRKDGREIEADNVTVFTNQTTITIVLTNLTMNDAGSYTCEAANEQSYRNDHVELRIDPLTVIHDMEDFTETNGSITAENKTLSLKLLATNIQVPCEVFKQNLQTILRSFIWSNYGYNVTIMAKQIECRMTESRAIYEINITGILTNNSLQPLLAGLNSTTQGIDITIGKLKLCYENCLEPTLTTSSTDSDSNNDDASANDIWIIVLSILIILFLFLVLCLVAISVRCLCTGNKTAEHHYITINRPMQKTADTTNVTKEASTNSTSTPSESQYDKLQFKYNDAKLSPKYLSPRYECLAIQHHTVTLNENILSAKTGINTNKAIHTKTAVATISEPTEIVSLERLQTDMLPTRVQQNYRIIPSPLYKSYVEVINCS